MGRYVRLPIQNFILYVPNPHEPSEAGGEHIKDTDPHLIHAVLEEIVKQYNVEGARVLDGQICFFSKDRGRHSGVPIVGMPNERDVRKALEKVGYQQSKKH
jgi:hypothetical protein